MKEFVKTVLIAVASIGISVIVIGVADLFSDSDFFIGWMGGGFLQLHFLYFLQNGTIKVKINSNESH